MGKLFFWGPFLAGALQLGVSAQAAETRPYCAAAGNKTHWWTWTAESMETACYTAMLKTFEMGKQINALHRGTYKTKGLNNATLRCQEGSRKVLGEGAEVFANAANMRSQLGWEKSCVVVVRP